MKKIMIGLFASMMVTASQAQQLSASEIPERVSNTFHKKFPQAENVKWERGDLKNIEANFQMNKTNYSAVFNVIGVCMETEMEIKKSELPAAVIESINKQYSGYKIKKTDKVEKPMSEVGFEVEIKKGKEILEVSLTAEGNILSKKIEAPDKNDKK